MITAMRLALMAVALGSSALPAQDAVPIPDTMHFCAQHCVTFAREADGRLYNYTNLLYQHDVKRVFEIQHFTPDSVVIRRTDYGSNPGAAVYTGRMESGNNGVHGQGWRITWGSALNDLPGSDAERDSIAAATEDTRPVEDRAVEFIQRSGGRNLLTERIFRLHDAIGAANDDCYRHEKSCRERDQLQNELAESTGNLLEEIDGMTHARQALNDRCNQGEQAACTNRDLVDSWILADRQAQFSGILH